MDYTEHLPPLPPIDEFLPTDGPRWTTANFIKAIEQYAPAYALAAIAAAAPAIRKAERVPLQRQCEVLRAERDQARAAVDNAVKLLTSIHSLLYPAPLKMADGRTLVFRPTDPDPHEVLQELSDRIRALPDEIAALGAAAIRALPEEP